MEYEHVIISKINAVLQEKSSITSISIISLCEDTVTKLGKKLIFELNGRPDIPGICYIGNQQYRASVPPENSQVTEMYAYILLVLAYDEHGKLVDNPQYPDSVYLFQSLRAQIFQVARYLDSLIQEKG